MGEHFKLKKESNKNLVTSLKKDIGPGSGKDKSFRDRILIGHLYLEHALNLLIKQSLKHPKSVIDYTFARKLEFLYALGIIDEDLNHNLRQMNKIRNEFAHKFLDEARFNTKDMGINKLKIQNLPPNHLSKYYYATIDISFTTALRKRNE